MKENFEKQMREIFESFEADVKPEVWQNIQSKMSQTSSGVKNTASGSGGIVASKGIIAGLLTVAGVAISSLTYYYINNRAGENPNQVSNSETIASWPGVDSASLMSEVSEQKQEELKNTEEQLSFTSVDNHSFSQSNSSLRSRQYSEKSMTAGEEKTGSEEGSVTPQPNPELSISKILREENPDEIHKKETKPEISHEIKETETQTVLYQILVQAQPETDDKTFLFSIEPSEYPVTWKINGAYVSENSTFSYTFGEYGQYEIEAVIRNGHIQRSLRKILEVVPVSSILFIPNIFTPNGDGYNDRFVVKLQNITNATLEIYNANGELVYSQSEIIDNTLSWDGKLNNGLMAEKGFYLYQINGIGQDGKTLSRKGQVKLER